jgi:nucleotide-binding universal stress UspA family protein
LLADLEAPAEVLMARNTPEGAHLRRALAILAGLGVPAQARVRHGLVVDEILAEARGGDYDMLVIGAHAVQRLMRFLLDDVTRQIISHVDRPVLVARKRVLQP